MACRICCVSLFYADWYTCWKYNSMYDHYNSVKCCNSQDYQKEQLKYRFMKKWKRMEWNSWKWTLFDPFYIDGTYLLQYSWSIKGNDEERCFARKLIRESDIWWKRIVETKSVNHFWACVLKYSKYTRIEPLITEVTRFLSTGFYRNLSYQAIPAVPAVLFIFT